MGSLPSLELVVLWHYVVVASGAALSTVALALQILLWKNKEKTFLRQPIFFLQLRHKIQTSF